MSWAQTKCGTGSTRGKRRARTRGSCISMKRRVWDFSRYNVLTVLTYCKHQEHWFGENTSETRWACRKGSQSTFIVQLHRKSVAQVLLMLGIMMHASAARFKNLASNCPSRAGWWGQDLVEKKRRRRSKQHPAMATKTLNWSSIPTDTPRLMWS